ncbi:hypothetical protein SETIT_2G135500v2 [Setaria italica]|uniref:Uncharacterized protein n=1 Tax=Setaria italica TaxID=4555 RepID=A0A368PYB0_SETIT|nr:hypothetical protein SETIT_2G135500v2 [Setaria italica]
MMDGRERPKACSGRELEAQAWIWAFGTHGRHDESDGTGWRGIGDAWPPRRIGWYRSHLSVVGRWILMNFRTSISNPQATSSPAEGSNGCDVAALPPPTGGGAPRLAQLHLTRWGVHLCGGHSGE